MKKPIRYALYAVGILYAGTVGHNIFVHYKNHEKGINESRKNDPLGYYVYGPNLRQQWSDFSKNELSELTSPKVLIPLSSLSSKKPLEVKVIEGGGVTIDEDE